MLDPDAVDLAELCLALDDRDYERSWWIHPETGEIKPHIPDVDGDETPEEDGWAYIHAADSREAYRDMADFVAAVPDRRAADLLDRAITGRGAFRRFKDVLFDFADLREAWFRFRDARATRRALDWLEDAGLVEPADAERARAAHPDPPLVHNPLAAAVAADLRELYGERLKEVLLFGSRARGGPHRGVRHGPAGGAGGPGRHMARAPGDGRHPLAAHPRERRRRQHARHRSRALATAGPASPHARRSRRDKGRMTDEDIALARRQLGAGHLLVDHGYPDVAASRAYYAAFHAAEAALLAIGEARSKHSGVISAFGQLVVLDGGFDRDLAQVLRTLFDHRNDADCNASPITREDSTLALADATRFVDAVEQWIAARPPR